MPPRARPIPRGVNSATYCVRQRKKTGNSGGHVIEFKVKGQSRYRLSSTCAECGAKKCTFLKSGAHPPQTVSGGELLTVAEIKKLRDMGHDVSVPFIGRPEKTKTHAKLLAGGRIKSTESKGRKAPGSEYTVGGVLTLPESAKGQAKRQWQDLIKKGIGANAVAHKVY